VERMEEKQPSVLADLCKADHRNANLSGAYLREAGLVEANRKAAEVGFARETRRSNLRGISQAKSLHLGHHRHGAFYNGVTVDEIRNGGNARLGIHHWADRFVGRGVLIDAYGFRKAKGQPV
jgi:Pentapeptide repeats (8 copies)